MEAAGRQLKMDPPPPWAEYALFSKGTPQKSPRLPRTALAGS